jgi:hypothetical protein
LTVERRNTVVHVLLSVCFEANAGDCLAAARGLLALSPRTELLLTAYAVVSLALSVILLFWAIHQHRRIERRLSQELADSVAATDRLQQKNDELTAANEQLRQTIAGLSGKLQEVPETVTGVTNKVNPQTSESEAGDTLSHLHGCRCTNCS